MSESGKQQEGKEEIVGKIGRKSGMAVDMYSRVAHDMLQQRYSELLGQLVPVPVPLVADAGGQVARMEEAVAVPAVAVDFVSPSILHHLPSEETLFSPPNTTYANGRQTSGENNDDNGYEDDFEEYQIHEENDILKEGEGEEEGEDRGSRQDDEILEAATSHIIEEEEDGSQKEKGRDALREYRADDSIYERDGVEQGDMHEAEGMVEVDRAEYEDEDLGDSDLTATYESHQISSDTGYNEQFIHEKAEEIATTDHLPEIEEVFELRELAGTESTNEDRGEYGIEAPEAEKDLVRGGHRFVEDERSAGESMPIEEAEEDVDLDLDVDEGIDTNDILDAEEVEVEEMQADELHESADGAEHESTGEEDIGDASGLAVDDGELEAGVAYEQSLNGHEVHDHGEVISHTQHDYDAYVQEDIGEETSIHNARSISDGGSEKGSDNGGTSNSSLPDGDEQNQEVEKTEGGEDEKDISEENGSAFAPYVMLSVLYDTSLMQYLQRCK